MLQFVFKTEPECGGCSAINLNALLPTRKQRKEFSMQLQCVPVAAFLECTAFGVKEPFQLTSRNFN